MYKSLVLSKFTYKQLLDEVFVTSGIFNQGHGKCCQPSRMPRLITLTKTLIILYITKAESNNCFIIHCFKINNDKYAVARNRSAGADPGF